MKRRPKGRARTLLGEFSRRLGSETLKVRIYRDRETLVCERELVERDGTSFTMVLPLKRIEVARALLEADPYYPHVRREVDRVLGRLERTLREEHGKQAA